MKKIFNLLVFFIIISCGFLSAGMTKGMMVALMPPDICIDNQLDTWENLPVASTASILNAITISTQSLTANTTTYLLLDADYTDIVFPKNVVINVDFATGKATTTVAGTLLITGLNQFGRTTTETISVTTTTATGSVAWSTITSLVYSGFTISGSSEADILLSVGTGEKIALTNNVRQSADFIKVIEAGATSTSYTPNYTYNTITFASAPDGSKDYYVLYKARYGKKVYDY